MRRLFQLMEDDEICLAGLDLAWEAVVDANSKTKWLIISSYPVPEGYNHRSVSVALRMPPSYPDDQIDMVYFFPSLALTSGNAIKQLSVEMIDGKQYQRWSRHRTTTNPWRPGLDNICTHLLQVGTWLERALKG